MKLNFSWNSPEAEFLATPTFRKAAMQNQRGSLVKLLQLEYTSAGGGKSVYLIAKCSFCLSDIDSMWQR